MGFCQPANTNAASDHQVPARKELMVRHTLVLGLCAELALAMFLLERRITMPATATTESARDMLGPPAVVPLATPEPPAKILFDQPVPEALARGQVFIQYRTENLRIEPVFGPTALGVTPR